MFGEPLYLQDSASKARGNHLRLVLSRIEMPLEAWEPLVSLMHLWDLVFRDEASRRAFLSAPRKFLRGQGVSKAVLRQYRHEIRLLELVADPYVRHVAGAGRYREFIARLKEHGLLHDDAEQSLRRRVKGIIEADLEHLRQRVAGNEAALTVESELADSADLYQVTRELAAVNGATQAVAAAAVVVVVAALAATYVSVGVNITVALNVGVTISVAVSTAVTTSGGVAGNVVSGIGSCDYCHGDVGAVAGLEPKMRENLELMIRAARLDRPAVLRDRSAERLYLR